MTAAAIAGLRVLVLDDEAMVLLLIEDMLQELGCAVVGPFARATDALRLIDQLPPEAALLDVNLSHGETGYVVADALAARGVPFAFVTGYDPAALREPHRTRPLLQKPFRMEALAKLLATLAASR